ncbi:MAG: hypothetical protein IJE40_03640 [Clostridia bacterium]|nr:hypothetical protein [Clostridia bacterium]
MTYILSDAELNVIVGFYGIVPGSLSPYTVSKEAKTKDVLNSLEKCGLVEHSVNEFYLSESGRVIAELLAAPEICVKFIKKSDGVVVTVFANDRAEPSVWCVCVRTADPAVNVLKIFLSKESVVSFLRKEVLILKTEFNENEDIDVVLTYEEWILFGLSQMSYMRFQTAGETFFDAENEYLSDNDIFSEKFFTFLTRDTDISPEAFSSAEKREKIYSSLCQKGIFVKNESDGTYKYSDIAKIWLDNDVSYDSLNVVYANSEGSAYTLMLTLRVNGVTTMYDTGREVRIVSSKSIPFSAYLS